MTAAPGTRNAADGVAALAELVGGGHVLVLTGAGISTESGIPDYRGPTGALRRSLPMTYQTFVADPVARQRYWARSQLGWRSVARAEPNAGHRAVTAMQRRGLLSAVVNVDGLHHAAGAQDVVELHGNLAGVVCLGCGGRTPRSELDRRLRAANRGWEAAGTRVNPDGDVDLDDAAVADFRLVGCARCEGILKPDVVFFGENVPPAKVAHCYDLVGRSRALLVLGSSLAVMSGLRFVRRAAGAGIPVGIANLGWTRGDDLATVRVHAPLGELLPALVAALGDVRG